MAPLPFTELSRAQQAQLLTLARRSMEAWVSRRADWPLGRDLDPHLLQPGASFVSLHAGGKLRGCLGSLVARQPLAVDVGEHARAVASEDYRFAPVQPEELADIEIEISVLTQPESMTVTGEADLLQQLRPGVDGLVLDDGRRRVTFLPLVWTQLPDPALFVRQLKRKAGWSENYWTDEIRVQRYLSLSFHE